MTAADDGSTFTLRRVQALLGLSRQIVDGLIEAGFVTPTRGRRNERRFTFQDLALLRTAHALQAQHIPPRRILQSLARLQATLPPELPLSGLRITGIGADIAVRDRNGGWQSDSGQLLLDFDVAPVAGTVTLLERAGPRRDAEHDAQVLFEHALSLEATDVRAAESAYLQALALAPRLEDAWLNLGALWAAADRYPELLRLSDAALNHCADSALLHFNRGVALDHLERPDEAAASYERSLALDPDLADAHFNLARLREEAGDQRAALRHLNAYRRLAP
ncbi:MAG TPA: tetratricopeptide repeat protein [Ramlibacter sp.]|uniref:tetratricopeptide repeat protein n=1 Tax=Ramlibacter sp. TaxID=1917967 RepID=UPI002ED4BF96